MTIPASLHPPEGAPAHRRVAAKSAVTVARLLALLPPHRIQSVLRRVARGAVPATFTETEAARDSVMAASLACLGPQGCLPRSLATALLCRMSGAWPRWCVGARVLPPFAAHAWVEAEGRLVGEGVPDDYFVTLFSVPPRDADTP